MEEIKHPNPQIFPLVEAAPLELLSGSSSPRELGDDVVIFVDENSSIVKGNVTPMHYLLSTLHIIH